MPGSFSIVSYINIPFPYWSIDFKFLSSNSRRYFPDSTVSHGLTAYLRPPHLYTSRSGWVGFPRRVLQLERCGFNMKGGNSHSYYYSELSCSYIYIILMNYLMVKWFLLSKCIYVKLAEILPTDNEVDGMLMNFLCTDEVLWGFSRKCHFFYCKID